MTTEIATHTSSTRSSALSMSAAEFRKVGHALVDDIAAYLGSVGERAVTKAEAPQTVRALLGDGGLPTHGHSAGELFRELTPLLLEHSLHNGHPRFFGYITSSAAPIGALADLLASAINANLAKWELAPLASEIETQTIRWLAELIGFPADCGGLLASGGNAANFLALVAARQAKTSPSLRTAGLHDATQRMTVYVSRETHTWVEKAANVSGLGTSSIRWIETDEQGRLDVNALRRRVVADRHAGEQPFLVVGTAGTTATGAIDPLAAIADFCRDEDLWMHVDGAYGAPAAALPESPADLKALALADSVVLDPHKWLYSPLEAACILTRDPRALPNALSYKPSYYRRHDDAATGIDYYEYGMQNSRMFRALKVWLGLRQAGRDGYVASIRDDISVAQHLFSAARAHREIEARTLSLSIATFRYVPTDLDAKNANHAQYMNELNEQVLSEIQQRGEFFLSNAVIDGDYYLRACCVNFRTTRADVDGIPEAVATIGRALDRQLRCRTQ